jgi:hypothetical protein
MIGALNIVTDTLELCGLLESGKNHARTCRIRMEI